MDIDINVVFCSTVGALCLCVGCVCIRGWIKRNRERERERQEFIASATQVKGDVQADVVIPA